MIREAAFRSLEADGLFPQGREDYLLSAIVHLLLLQVTSKGVPYHELLDNITSEESRICLVRKQPKSPEEIEKSFREREHNWFLALKARLKGG